MPKIALLSELLLMLPTSKTEIPTLIVGIEMAHSFTTRPIFKQAGSTTQNMNKAGGGDITIKVRVFYASLSRLSLEIKAWRRQLAAGEPENWSIQGFGSLAFQLKTTLAEKMKTQMMTKHRDEVAKRKRAREDPPQQKSAFEHQ